MKNFDADLTKSSGMTTSASGDLKPVANIGEEGKKYVSNLEVPYKSKYKGRSRDAGEYFVKEIKKSSLSILDRPDLQLKKHERLRTLGLPVAPTFRIDKNTNRIFMTEMTEGGQKRIVDKHHRLSKFDQIENLSQLKDEIRSIAEIAFNNGNGVLLSLDAFSIVVDQNNVGKVFLIDLGREAELLKEGEAEYFIDYKGRKSQKFTLRDARQRAQLFISYALEGKDKLDDFTQLDFSLPDVDL